MGFKETHRSRQRRLLIWFAVAILVIVSCSALVMAKITANNDRAHAQQSPTVTGVPTKNAITPTPSVTASPSPSLTATPTTLFAEDFVNNSKQWAITNVPGLVRTMQNDQLVLSVNGGRILTESIPSSTSFSDFTLIAEYTLNTAGNDDRVGLYVRGDSNLDHDYRIDILGDNTVTISKEYLDDTNQPQSVELARKSNVSAIHPLGHPNTLQVELNGPTLSVMINDKPVISSLYDADYSHGQIALFVNNSSNSTAGVTAYFSSIEIDSIPNPLPMPTPTPSVTSTPNATETPTPTGTMTPSATGTSTTK